MHLFTHTCRLVRTNIAVKAILLMSLIWTQSIYAQEFESIDDEDGGNATYSLKEDNEYADLGGFSNKGVFITTYIAGGYCRRFSNGDFVKSKPGVFGINFGATLEVGVFRNLRAGLRVERPGYFTQVGDSLKIYSLNMGLDFHVKLASEEDRFYYSRVGMGLSSLQMLDIYVVSNQDSLIWTSNKGGYANLEFGVERRINPTVTCYYGVKTNLQFYTEMAAVNIYNPKERSIMYVNRGTAAERKYRISYGQLMLVFGLSFKL